MKKTVFFVMVAVAIALCATGCSSLFGGGDWKSDVVNTLVADHDEFTMETEYTMQESGFYYSILPVKLSYTTGDDDINEHDWRLTVTQYETMGFSHSFFMNSVAIMNSRGDRFIADLNDVFISEFGEDTTGSCLLNDEEISQLYQVFTDIDSLEYIRIRFNDDDELVYDMTQPSAYAVTYFIDYIRNQVQPTEV